VKLLGALERPYYALVRPSVDALIRSGVRPNTITTIGTGFVLVSAIAYGMGHVRIGGALLLVSGIADTLDGQVARGGAMVTKFGAFYDSTLDRVGDGATFIGIAVFLLTAPDVAWRLPAVILCMVAILASLLVSYARARAEGLGLDCKVGIAQRAERILGLGLISLITVASARARRIGARVTRAAQSSHANSAASSIRARAMRFSGRKKNAVSIHADTASQAGSRRTMCASSCAMMLSC
jgi:CDP-diacylglycerol--glycerol-3-phosphate 3-phosphatidyltransferase